MKYLVDTNAWIGFLDGRENYGARARYLIEQHADSSFVSIASIWEAAIKVGIGKLRLPYNLEVELPSILDDFSMEILPIAYSDAVSVKNLDGVHGDPFDRMQVVQARRFGLEIISADSIFDYYGLKRHW